MILGNFPLLPNNTDGDIALCVLEPELAPLTTASEWVRCAGDAWWPQRRVSMTPDVHVTPESIHST